MRTLRGTNSPATVPVNLTFLFEKMNELNFKGKCMASIISGVFGFRFQQNTCAQSANKA
jgi:hypothetical protein